MVQQNFAVNLDDAVYQAAQGRAQAEGKSLEQALLELLGVYAQDAPAVTSYTVQRGDTLSKIARTVYGDAYQYPLIQKANNLGDPGNIWVGQVLVIPAIAGTAPPPPSSPPPRHRQPRLQHRHPLRHLLPPHHLPHHRQRHPRRRLNLHPAWPITPGLCLVASGPIGRAGCAQFINFKWGMAAVRGPSPLLMPNVRLAKGKPPSQT